MLAGEVGCGRRLHGKVLWKKVKVVVNTSKLDENQLRRYQAIQTHALQAVLLWDFDGPRDDLGCLEKAGYVAFYLCVAKYLDSSFQMASAAATVEVRPYV
ncbi:hypothetical protein DYB28_004690 [Aphanomyces astaci]|uniref:Uncharacterized protein n=1 Tax=Aphanomyces astaci TaxID=112090 RepID=A0A397CZ85_APHAT|nr:hypothetical protein DYB25_001262 [Aphanomyces astaci]RHY53599.1 hypothetical protein DYB34_010041 [Aphanomyces astaci]RHY56002.1 hypothetical protein DYB38_008283 [Aphanomyces astaci]RHY76844.1 hypothetical protein DYB30_004035 [Aphanomyces astaci]RHZ08183.1 hypothetical protein DYB26_010939 [Aphanomyces astaci]